MHNIFNTYLSFKSANNNSNIRVVGCRRSGKSYLAEYFCHNVPGEAQILDASSLLRSDRWSLSPLEAMRPQNNPIDRDLLARIEIANKKNSLTLIVDNSEILLVHISDEVFLKFIEAISSNRLRLIMIRNRFVREGYGWLYRRELPLSSLLPRIDIFPLNKEDSLKVALSFFQNQSESSHERALWLSEWSGGLAGLMFDLKPLTPQKPIMEECPEELYNQIRQTAMDLGLERPFRQAVIEAANFNLLGPPELLHTRVADEVGFLAAIGMLNPFYATENKPFQGRFWSAVAETVVNINRSFRSDFAEMALRLEELLEQANVAPQVAAELGYMDAKKLSLIFERTLLTQEETSLPSINLKRFLGETLGRSGLKRVLRAAGQSFSLDDDVLKLSSQIFDLAQS